MISPRAFLWSAPSRSLEGLSLILKLTALVILSNGVPVWYLRPLVLILASLLLIFEGALRSRTVWGALLLLTVARIGREWPSVDNHQYLLAYWILAVLIALSLPHPRRALGTSARWLIVCVFLLATAWKALFSPDFLDGRFYRASLLKDPRFEQKVLFLGRMSRLQLEENRTYLSFVDTLEASERPAALRGTPRFDRLVLLLTWSTVLLEGTVALAFLLPWGRRTRIVRHGTLLVFCAGTYVLAPIYIFGWLLLVMGLAQVSPRDRVLRAAYVGVFLLFHIYRDVDWDLFLAHWRALPFV